MKNFKIQNASLEPTQRYAHFDLNEFCGGENLGNAERCQQDVNPCSQGVSRLFASGAEAMIAKLPPLQLPENLFSLPADDGAAILQKYLDAMAPSERYDFLAPLVRKEWKWFCKAAPHLILPEPKPLREGEPIRIGIRMWQTNAACSSAKILCAN
ncbi:MAG: hypothetical protein LBB38_01345 [Puniceicoccales bacterium]|jgi:hypothetical protein|nr:hypothetical protein [Puniceicoccales bacterium]